MKICWEIISLFEYICQDMDQHSIAVLITEYVEYIIGDSDQMLPHIEEFIGSIMNEKKL